MTTAVWGKTTTATTMAGTATSAPPARLADIMQQQAQDEKMDEWEALQLKLALEASLADVGIVVANKEEEEEDAERPVQEDTENDLAIAQQLQEEYLREHDRHIAQLERAVNTSSKVTVSYRNHLLMEEEEENDKAEKRRAGAEEEEEEEEEQQQDYSKLYQLNEKDHRAFQHSNNGNGNGSGEKEIITKHDIPRSSRKNAKKIEGFPLDFNSGNTIDDTSLRLPNSVFNSLKEHSRRNPHSNSREKSKIHDRDDTATQERVLDPRTRLLLFKLVDSHAVESIEGIISSGKEANVYQGKFNKKVADLEKTTTPVTETATTEEPVHCAFKVFKTTLNEFKHREEYIKGDYRFNRRVNRQNPRKFIKLWAEKEMENLTRLAKAGIPCPQVLWYKSHVLIMSLIGNNENAAPQLKAIHAFLSASRIQELYDQATTLLSRMYHEARLVHADFSEYNLLYHDGSLHVIDVSQAIDVTHPKAHLFLYRDCDTITRFFMTAGVQHALSPLELFVQTIAAEVDPSTMASLQREIAAIPPKNLAALQPVIDKIMVAQRYVTVDQKDDDDNDESDESSTSTSDEQ